MTNLKLYNYRNVWLNALASSSRRRASRCFCFARVALVSGRTWPGLDSSSSSEDFSTGRNMSALLARLGGLTWVCTRPQDKGIPGGLLLITICYLVSCSVSVENIWRKGSWQNSGVLWRTLPENSSKKMLKTTDAKKPDRIAVFCEDHKVKVLQLERCWKQLTQRILTE